MGAHGNSIRRLGPAVALALVVAELVAAPQVARADVLPPWSCRDYDLPQGETADTDRAAYFEALRTSAYQTLQQHYDEINAYSRIYDDFHPSIAPRPIVDAAAGGDDGAIVELTDGVEAIGNYDELVAYDMALDAAHAHRESLLEMIETRRYGREHGRQLRSEADIADSQASAIQYAFARIFDWSAAYPVEAEQQVVQLLTALDWQGVRLVERDADGAYYIVRYEDFDEPSCRLDEGTLQADRGDGYYRCGPVDLGATEEVPLEDGSIGIIRPWEQFHLIDLDRHVRNTLRAQRDEDCVRSSRLLAIEPLVRQRSEQLRLIAAMAEMAAPILDVEVLVEERGWPLSDRYETIEYLLTNEELSDAEFFTYMRAALDRLALNNSEEWRRIEGLDVDAADELSRLPLLRARALTQNPNLEAISCVVANEIGWAEVWRPLLSVGGLVLSGVATLMGAPYLVPIIVTASSGIFFAASVVDAWQSYLAWEEAQRRYLTGVTSGLVDRETVNAYHAGLVRAIAWAVVQGAITAFGAVRIYMRGIDNLHSVGMSRAMASGAVEEGQLGYRDIARIALGDIDDALIARLPQAAKDNMCLNGGPCAGITRLFQKFPNARPFESNGYENSVRAAAREGYPSNFADMQAQHPGQVGHLSRREFERLMTQASGAGRSTIKVVLVEGDELPRFWTQGLRVSAATLADGAKVQGIYELTFDGTSTVAVYDHIRHGMTTFLPREIIYSNAARSAYPAMSDVGRALGLTAQFVER